MSDRKVVHVRDVMKKDFDVVDGMATVSEALKQLEHVDDTKCLIVDKRDDDDEYGIVMLSDIARKVIGADRAPGRVNVYEIMAKPVICVDPGMDIRYCARLFDRFGLSRAPVVQLGKLVGIVSYNDMVLKGLSLEF